MSDTVVHEGMAEGLAELEQIVATPVEPFGYGVDWSCVTDVTETFDEVDPASFEALWQALVRRLDTERGTLPIDAADAADYGFGIRSRVNRALTRGELRSMAGQIRSELEKDDRVDSIDEVNVTQPTLKALSISVVVTPANHEINGFALTFAVTSGSVVVEAITAA